MSPSILAASLAGICTALFVQTDWPVAACLAVYFVCVSFSLALKGGGE